MYDGEVLTSLRESMLFSAVSEEVLGKVAQIVTKTSIKAGEKLIEKGELGESMYILCRGKVKVHDGDLVLNCLEQGNAFGEMAALDGEIRTASITAVSGWDIAAYFKATHEVAGDFYDVFEIKNHRKSWMLSSST